MNKVILVGNLTKDPEIRETSSGKLMSRFCIAVNRYYNRKECDFIYVKAFGQNAEFVKSWAQKGDKISICGSVQNDNYEKDGKQMYKDEIIAHELSIVSKKGQVDA